MADDTGGGTSVSTSAGSSPAPSTATTSTSSGSTTPASATATPQTTPGAATTTTTGQAGDPPQERWPDILNNARTKTRGEVEAEYRQKYGWADQFHSDPLPFVETWMDQLAENPQLSPRILAKAARMLQSRRGSQPAQVLEEPAPNVPIVDGSGNITGYTYDAKGLKAWREWNKAQDKAEADQRFAPLEKRQQEADQQAFVQQIQQQADQSARTTLDTLRTNPYFKENESKVRAALDAHKEWGDNVHAAFNYVLVTDILPNASATAQRKVVEQLQQKAGASGVNPGGSSSGPMTRADFTKMGSLETMKWMDAHPEEAKAWANGRS